MVLGLQNKVVQDFMMGKYQLKFKIYWSILDYLIKNGESGNSDKSKYFNRSKEINCT